jgi:hypothetical protein
VIGRALLLLLLLPATARGADVLGWQDAAKHVGEQATVEGVVAAVHCSPLACSIAFEPTFTRFTAIIQAERFDVFPPAELEARYKGRRIRITGTIETIDGKPRMQIAKPEALALVQDEKRPDAQGVARDSEPAATVSGAQAEILDRLAEILQRLDTLSEQLAATEERMAGLLSYLDERERNLAAAQMTPAGPPPIRPAPAAQSLRSLKRGMSSGDVERLAGRPLDVIDEGNGWTTWDYGGGRAVTFDNRGRVQSLTGWGY